MGAPHGNGAERFRLRELTRCDCGREVWREAITRGALAGGWRVVDIEGKKHTCKQGKP